MAPRALANAAGLALAISLGALGPARAQAPEYAVKANYLYKFVPFVDWPPAAASGPVSLCVVGDDPFGAALEQAVDGQRLGDRPVTVRRLGSIGRGSRCTVVYAAGSRSQSAGQILSAVRGEPVLTVTDGAIQATAKGAIHFVVIGNRVRFEIDPGAAAANGLSISSKLMSLALAVRARP